MKKELIIPLKEKLISFETAILAKEKGFDEFCRKGFNENGESSGFSGYVYMKKYNKNSAVHFIDTNTEEFTYPKIVCTQPTQSLLQKWLREVHNIHIEINRTYEKGYYLYEYFINKNKQLFGFKSYEEALEIGLQEALKLLKNS